MYTSFITVNSKTYAFNSYELVEAEAWLDDMVALVELVYHNKVEAAWITEN